MSSKFKALQIDDLISGGVGIFLASFDLIGALGTLIDSLIQ
jgi:hypothetical protein